MARIAPTVKQHNRWRKICIVLHYILYFISRPIAIVDSYKISLLLSPYNIPRPAPDFHTPLQQKPTVSISRKGGNVLEMLPFLKCRHESRTSGDAAGRGSRGSVACIAGARHTTLSPGSPLCLLSWRNKKVGSCCGTRHLRRRQSAFLICRPLPLAQLALSAQAALASLPRRRRLRSRHFLSTHKTQNFPPPPLVQSANIDYNVAKSIMKTFAKGDYYEPCHQYDHR